MSYRRVTSVDRLRIKDGLDAGLSKTVIAGKLGFNKSTIGREITRNEGLRGYRLNNLPCQDLVANRAYFLFAMMAHNMLRLLSLMDDPETPCMSKKTRRKFINFPARILNRSKRLWLKVPHQFYKGVIELIEGWRLPEKMFAHMFSTA